MGMVLEEMPGLCNLLFTNLMTTAQTDNSLHGVVLDEVSLGAARVRYKPVLTGVTVQMTLELMTPNKNKKRLHLSSLPLISTLPTGQSSLSKKGRFKIICKFHSSSQTFTLDGSKFKLKSTLKNIFSPPQAGDSLVSHPKPSPTWDILGDLMFTTLSKCILP